MVEPKGFFFESLDSTQDWVKEHAPSLPHFSWVQALSQTKGRGRRGNTWVSPLGSLYLTLWLPLPPEPFITWMPLAFSLWIADYVQTTLGLHLKVKWPNDLWLQSKKCGGLLCERTSLGLMVGCGLNLQEPDGLPQATSLSAHYSPSGIKTFGSKIACHLMECYQATPQTELWGKQYLERAVLKPGDLIVYQEAGSSVQGRVVGLGPQATLRVHCGVRERELFAGEVSLVRGLG